MTGRSIPRAGTTTRVAVSRPAGCFVAAGVGAGETPGSTEPDGDGDGNTDADGDSSATSSVGSSTTSGVGTTTVPAVVGPGYVSRPAVMRTTPSAVSSAGRIRDVRVLRKAMGRESYWSTVNHALRPVVLVRSCPMGGKTAIGGGLVMGLLVGAAIVAGVVVLT